MSDERVIDAGKLAQHRNEELAQLERLEREARPDVTTAANELLVPPDPDRDLRPRRPILSIRS